MSGGPIETIGKSIAEVMTETLAPKAAPAIIPRPPVAAPGVVTPPLSQRFSIFEAPALPDTALMQDPNGMVMNAELARATQDLQDQMRASTDAQAMHRMSQGFLSAKNAMMAALQPSPVLQDQGADQTAQQPLIGPMDIGNAALTQIKALRDTAQADHERIAHVLGFDHRPLLFEQPATPESAMLIRLAPWAHGVALEAERAGIDIDKALAGAPVGDGTQQTTAPMAMMRTKMLADMVSAKDPTAAVGPPKDLIDIPPELQKSQAVSFPPARPMVLPGPGQTTAEHAPSPAELQSGGPRSAVQQQNVLAQLSGWQGVPDAARIQFGRPDSLRLTDAQEIPVDIDNEGRLIAHVPSPNHMNETIPVELVGGDLARAGLSPDLEPILIPGEHSPVVMAYDPATNRAYVDKEWTAKREWLQQTYNRSDRADIATADTNPISAILTTLQLPNPSPDFVNLLDRHIAEQAQRAPGLMTEAVRDAGPGAKPWEVDREFTKLLREHSLVTAGLEAAKAITMRRVQLTLGEPDPIYNPDPKPEAPSKELRYESGFSSTEQNPNYVSPWNRLKPYEGTDDLTLVEVAKRLLHPDPISFKENPKGAMRRLVRVLSDEVAKRLELDPTGADWYRGQLAQMDSVLRTHLFPDASEIEHALFRVPLGLTSIGQTVSMNFELAHFALEQYLLTGAWPLNGPFENRWPGTRSRTIQWLMERFDWLHHKHFGGSGSDLIAFLLQKHPNGASSSKNPNELRGLANVLRTQTPAKVGPSIDGAATDLNYGARIFGPKVGNFILNMYGVPELVTVDAWATRSMRRILGIAKQTWDITGERQILDDTISPKERRMLQQAITIAATKNGVSPMDAQALLWGHEKELWAHSGAQAESAEGFGDVAQRFVGQTAGERVESMAAPVLRDTGGYLPGEGDTPNPGRSGSGRLQRLGRAYRQLAGLEPALPRVSIKPAHPKATSAVAVHYSPKAGLTELEPAQAGTGAKGSQVRRFGTGQHGLQGGLAARSYFYVQEGATLPTAERGVDTSNAYTVQLDNLYDLREDPLGLWADPRNQMNRDRLEEAVSAAGFDGLISAPAPGMEVPFGVVFDLGGARIPVVPAVAAPSIPKSITPSTELDLQLGLAYDAMPHNPADLEVAMAYTAFKAETLQQFSILVSDGYRFEFATPETMYKSSEEMHADAIGNKRILIFPTVPVEGYGASGMTPPHPDWPLLELVPNTAFTYNDIFRGVHDLFGHAMNGSDFSHVGEITAWLEHSQMYSPLAQRALDTETIGQENWYSTRPADQTEALERAYRPEDLQAGGAEYAEQKAGVLPLELTAAARLYYGDPVMQEVQGRKLTQEQIDQYAKSIPISHRGKTFDEQNYPVTVNVRVTFSNGQSHIDAVKGMNAGHALARAGSNWPSAISIEALPTSMPISGLTVRDARKRLQSNDRVSLTPEANEGLRKLAELGPVKWKGGIGTFAMGINPDALPILKDGMIDIRNKVIKNPRDLAQVMQAFRHTYEIHHLVAVGESGRIHAHYAATSKLPGQTVIAAVPYAKTYDFLKDWLQRVQETAGEPIKFHSVHNHPSGEVEPSTDDRGLMATMAALFPHHFAGGLIINGNKYTQLMPRQEEESIGAHVRVTSTRIVELKDLPLVPASSDEVERWLSGDSTAMPTAPDPLLTPSLPHEILETGPMINSVQVARAISRVAHAPEDYVTVLLASTHGEARAGFYVPKNFMLDARFEGWLANRMRETGGGMAFLRIPEVSFDHPLAQKAFELQRNGPVVDTQVGDMDSGYNANQFLRSVQHSDNIGLIHDTHGQISAMRAPQVPYQGSLERAQALAHLASGKSFSSKPKLFEVLTDDEKFHAVQVRIAEGYVSRSLNHLKNLNPQKWETSTFPKYFGAWRPNASQMTVLKDAYSKRVTELQATWALADKMKNTVAAKRRAGIPAGRKMKVTERVPLEDFLRFDPNEIDELLKNDPSTYAELVRQFFAHSTSIEAELDNFGNVTAREQGLAKLDTMRDMFHQGALDIKDSGTHPISIPRSPLSGLQRRMLSAKQNSSALRTLVRLMGRPSGMLGVRKQLPHPIDRIAAEKSGELDQSLFYPIYNGALKSHTDFNQSARDFMPLSEAANVSEDLDRAIFTALELRLDDRELARPEWNGFKIRRPGTLVPTTINLKDWIPRLRDKYDKLIKDVETSKIAQTRMKIVQDKYDILTIEAELRRRELEAAQEDDPTATDWDQVDPKVQDAIRKALKSEDHGDSSSTDFAYLHGGMQGYTGPAPVAIGGRSYQSLVGRHATSLKRVETAKGEIEAIQNGSLRRDGYVTHSYQLIRDAVRNDMQDPYSVSYRYVHPTVRNHYLDERLSDKEPFKSWAVNWFLYLHKMHETAYLEPELKKATQQLLKVPDDQRIYLQHWLLRLQNVDAPLDRTLNRVQYNALMEEPGVIDGMYKAFTGKPFKDVVDMAKDGGDLSHRGWTNLSEAWRTLTMTSLLSPIRVARLNLTEASFMLYELSKRPVVDLPMGVIWGATGMLQAHLDGAGEFLSWLGSHTGLMERYYSRPSKLGVADSLDDIHEHRQQLLRGREQNSTDKMAQKALQYRGMLIRATEFMNRAMAFHVKEMQYKFYGASDEFAEQEAAKDVLDMWGAYGKRDTSPVASSQLWKQWWSLKRFTSAKSGSLATGLMGASEAVKRGLGKISPDRFGVVQPSAAAGDQGMLPPPPPPPPAHPDSSVGDFTDPDEMKELDWLTRSPAPFGAAFPAGPDAALRHFYSVMVGLPLTLAGLYMIGSMVTEKYRRVSAMRIWDNVDPWQWNNIAEIPGFFWNKDLSLVARYSAYGELFGRTAQEQQKMEKSVENLLYKFPIAGAILFERAMNAKEAQRNSMAPAPPSTPKLPGIPGEVRGRRLVKRGILQRVMGALRKEKVPDVKPQEVKK